LFQKYLEIMLKNTKKEEKFAINTYEKIHTLEETIFIKGEIDPNSSSEIFFIFSESLVF
jgi:hypothetical protein